MLHENLRGNEYHPQGLGCQKCHDGQVEAGIMLSSGMYFGSEYILRFLFRQKSVILVWREWEMNSSTRNLNFPSSGPLQRQSRRKDLTRNRMSGPLELSFGRFFLLGPPLIQSGTMPRRPRRWNKVIGCQCQNMIFLERIWREKFIRWDPAFVHCLYSNEVMHVFILD